MEDEIGGVKVLNTKKPQWTMVSSYALAWDN